MNKTKKWTCMLLTFALLLTLMPTAALAADVGIVSGLPTGANVITKNTTVVGFAGQEWWVIDTGSDNVTNPGAGSITLLLKSTGNPYGNTAFRTGQNTEPGDTTGWNQYGGDGWWYQGSFTWPNGYNDSTLQRKMVDIANGMPSKEAALITARDIGTSDGIGGAVVSAQKLWPLSQTEWSAIGADPFKKEVGA